MKEGVKRGLYGDSALLLPNRPEEDGDNPGVRGGVFAEVAIPKTSLLSASKETDKDESPRTSCGSIVRLWNTSSSSEESEGECRVRLRLEDGLLLWKSCPMLRLFDFMPGARMTASSSCSALAAPRGTPLLPSPLFSSSDRLLAWPRGSFILALDVLFALRPFRS